MSARIFVEPARLAQGKLRVEGGEHHYLTRVRRLGAGDEVVVADGAGREATARVEATDKSGATLDVGAPELSRAAPPIRLSVAIAPVKGDRTEWAIQKLVELGVGGVYPMETARSVVVLRGRRASARIERYRSIAAEAARQSENPIVPQIAELEPLPACVDALAGAELKLAFWEGAQGRPLRDHLSDGSRWSHVALLIGPEGGLADSEIARAEEAGFSAVGLGPRILRAETAAVAAAAVVQHRLGDLG